MECELDLREIPKRPDGKNSWKDSIGKNVYFSINDKTYHFKIIDYSSLKLVVEFQNKIKTISLISIYQKNFKHFFEKTSGYSSGDIIHIKTGEIKYIKEETRKQGKKDYIFIEAECSKCHTVSTYRIDRCSMKNNCPVCIGKKVIAGVNSLWDRYPYVAMLLEHPEEGYKLSGHSYKHRNFICPYCKKVHFKEVNYISKYGLTCDCGYKMSYAQLLVTNLFKLLPYTVESEKKFEWSQNEKTKHFRRYDIYIPAFNAIVEVHGYQHYHPNKIYQKNLEEIQANDVFKENLAKNNGINNYYIIDGRYSTLSHLKKSMIKNKEVYNLFYKYGIDLKWDSVWNFAIERSQEYREEWLQNKEMQKQYMKLA